MDSNYEKGVFNQLTDVMAKLDAMKSEHKQDRKKTKKAGGSARRNSSAGRLNYYI